MSSRTICVVITAMVTVAMFVTSCFLLRRTCRFSRMAVFVGCCHLTLVVVNALSVEFDMSESYPSEALMGWLWFDLIDIPVSVLGLLVSALIKSFRTREIILPIVFYGYVGSAQCMLFAELFSRGMTLLCQKPNADQKLLSGDPAKNKLEKEARRLTDYVRKGCHK